jgi:TRAP-type C4-dicarboxylate transport system substrate-binding protein
MTMIKLLRAGAIAALALAGAASVASAAEVKLALDCTKDLQKCGTYVWSDAFTKKLEAAGMKVTQFEREALGGEEERLDQVSQGLLEVSNSDLKQAAAYDPFVFGAMLPYLFDNIGQFDKAVSEEGLLDKINGETAKHGVRVLAFIPVGDATGIFNTKHKVEKPADMVGLRMRALDDRQIKLFEAWGATGTIVPMSEVPNALQTGVADGYLNPSIVPLLFGHTDFLKYFTDAQVAPSLRVAIASEQWYSGLSDADRKAVDEAAAAGNAANRAWLKKTSAATIDQLKAKKVEVTELSPEGRKEFREKSVAAYDTMLPADQAKVWIDAAEKAKQ